MDASPFFADISRLESLLGLPIGFLERLIEEDDWSFVIKSHAIVEAALTNLITSTTDPRLTAMFRKLNIDGRFSKLEIAKAVSRLNPPTLALIKELSVIRNDFVHDIKYVSIDLPSYVEAMPTQDRQRLAKLIAKVVTDSDEEGWSTLAEKELSDEPKSTLAIATFAILAQILFKINPDEYTHARTRAYETLNNVTPKLMLPVIFVLLVMAALQNKDNNKTSQD